VAATHPQVNTVGVAVTHPQVNTVGVAVTHLTKKCNKGGSKALDNNTLLFLQYHIYKKKLQDDSLLLQDFVSQIKYKYSLEKKVSNFVILLLNIHFCFPICLFLSCAWVKLQINIS